MCDQDGVGFPATSRHPLSLLVLDWRSFASGTSSRADIIGVGCGGVFDLDSNSLATLYRIDLLQTKNP